MAKGPAPRPPIDRFNEKYIKVNTGCWIWQATTNGKYGRFFPGGPRNTPQVYAHRWSYEHHIGPIPEGFTINHLCEQPLCVNPDHLEAVTMRANLRYGNNPVAHKARQTHCIHGHPFDETNTYIKGNGTRACLACKKQIMRERRAGLPDAPPCSIDDCPKKAMTRGWCSFHYGRWWHYGDPLREPPER